MSDKKKKKKESKRRHPDSDEEEHERKKKKRNCQSSSDEKRKHKHKKHKKKNKKQKMESGSEEASVLAGPSIGKVDKQEGASPASRSMKPMTKEEWEKQQSVIRRVYDPDTGRTRLVKGDGEILEEIVSREKQREINKRATAGDGESYQRAVGLIT